MSKGQSGQRDGGGGGVGVAGAPPPKELELGATPKPIYADTLTRGLRHRCPGRLIPLLKKAVGSKFRPVRQSHKQ